MPKNNIFAEFDTDNLDRQLPEYDQLRGGTYIDQLLDAERIFQNEKYYQVNGEYFDIFDIDRVRFKDALKNFVPESFDDFLLPVNSNNRYYEDNFSGFRKYVTQMRKDWKGDRGREYQNNLELAEKNQLRYGGALKKAEVAELVNVQPAPKGEVIGSALGHFYLGNYVYSGDQEAPLPRAETPDLLAIQERVVLERSNRPFVRVAAHEWWPLETYNAVAPTKQLDVPAEAPAYLEESWSYSQTLIGRLDDKNLYGAPAPASVIHGNAPAINFAAHLGNLDKAPAILTGPGMLQLPPGMVPIEPVLREAPGGIVTAIEPRARRGSEIDPIRFAPDEMWETKEGYRVRLQDARDEWQRAAKYYLEQRGADLPPQFAKPTFGAFKDFPQYLEFAAQQGAKWRLPAKVQLDNGEVRPVNQNARNWEEAARDVLYYSYGLGNDFPLPAPQKGQSFQNYFDASLARWEGPDGYSFRQGKYYERLLADGRIPDANITFQKLSPADGSLIWKLFGDEETLSSPIVNHAPQAQPKIGTREMPGRALFQTMPSPAIGDSDITLFDA
ncbi:MAG: hypothetical protein KF874_02795 [Rhizobiaceae bacterium]|nr:hypothetical protein [Rhizobiaceae bacterium]